MLRFCTSNLRAQISSRMRRRHIQINSNYHQPDDLPERTRTRQGPRQIQLHQHADLANQEISEQEPTAPPAWMLKYFSYYFVPEKMETLGPEEHNHPPGVTGVYAYLITAVIAACCSVALIHEKFFTNSEDLARAAMREKRIREEVRRIQAERGAAGAGVVDKED